MKKLLALALVAMMLLTAAACAEAPSTTLVLSDVALTSIHGKNVETVRVPELRVEGAIGMSGMIPSVEMTFIYGDADQELGAIVQLVGTDLLGSVGSISSVFALSLEKLAGDAAGLAAMAIGSTISMGSVSLAALINALTQEGENGVRVAHFDLPTERFVAAANRALDKAAGLDAAEGVDFEAIRGTLEGLGDTVALDIAYDLVSGDFSATLSHDEHALRLSGVATLGNAPFTYADVDLSAERVDVTNLTDADIERLNDEASLMAGRLINMAAAMGLSKYFPGK